MSTQIKDLFFHALIARASYANLEGGMYEDEIRLRLMDGQSAMTGIMADYFMEHFEVITSTANTITGSVSGYDAIIFHEKNTDHYILANRGTETSASAAPFDLYQDLVLALTGVNGQEYSMLNFIGDNIPSGANFTIAGHSLGGFLTTWAQIIYPEKFRASYTYNGAGVLNVAGVGTIANMFSTVLGRELVVAPDTPVFNIRTGEGVDLTSSAGFYVGAVQDVYTDMGWYDGVGGHSIVNLSDALLVAYVLGEIDGSLSIDGVNKIAEQMAKFDALDRNYTIAYLGELFYGYSQVDSFRNDNTNELQLQEMAFRLLGDIESGTTLDFNASIKILSTESVGSLASIAHQEDGNGALMRHALLGLSSFALQDVLYNASLPPALNEFMFGEAYGVGMFKGQIDESYKQVHSETDFWRNLAEMAQANAVYNEGQSVSLEQTFINDWNRDRYGEDERVGNGRDIRYFGSTFNDGKAGSHGDDRLYGLDGNDTLLGKAGNDYLEGGRNNDILDGGEGEDVLMGGDGIDTLTGGKGNDQLYGGKGIDTYVWNTGDGVDRIIEEDEESNDEGGRLKLNGKIIGRVVLDSETGLYKGAGFYFKDLGSSLSVFDEERNLVLTVKNFNRDTNNMGLIFDEDPDEPEDGSGNMPRPMPPTTSPPPRDPFVIDLDGDGLETVGIGAGILFDHGNDGIAENSGWVGEDDALLVRDLNGDGKINNGSELFGNFTQLKDGTLARDGYVALADLDSNGDGFITADDVIQVEHEVAFDANGDGEITPDEITTEIVEESVFSQLRLWRDRNQNGQTDAGELLTLEQVGINAISVNGNYRSVTQADGNILRGTSVAMTDDGRQLITGIYDFEASPIHRAFTDPVTIPPELKNLPTLTGMGQVRDLREAAALSPELAALLDGGREERAVNVDGIFSMAA